MDQLISDSNLSSSMQTTLAIGGTLVLVAGVVIHRHKDLLSSLLAENIASEQMNQNTDWQNLTISAEVSCTIAIDCCRLLALVDSIIRNGMLTIVLESEISNKKKKQSTKINRVKS
jgi:hypothetical protein